MVTDVNETTYSYVGDQAVATEEVVAETPMYAINNEDELQEFLIMEVRSHEAIWNQVAAKRRTTRKIHLF